MRLDASSVSRDLTYGALPQSAEPKLVRKARTSEKSQLLGTPPVEKSKLPMPSVQAPEKSTRNVSASVKSAGRGLPSKLAGHELVQRQIEP